MKIHGGKYNKKAFFFRVGNVPSDTVCSLGVKTYQASALIQL